jgi:stress response protein SCP2
MTTTDLIKGANAALQVDDEPVQAARVSVGWSSSEGLDIDVSALLLDPSGRVRGDHDFVFYNQPEAEEGAIRLLGKTETEQMASDRLLVALGDLSEEVARVVVLVSLDAPEGVGFGSVRDLAASVTTSDEQELIRFVVPELGLETAVVLGELYRRESGWRFRAVGQGYVSGLAGVATDYGITVDDSDEPSVQVVEVTDDDVVVMTSVLVISGGESVPADSLDAAPGDAEGESVDLDAADVEREASQRRPSPVRTRKQPLTATPVRALTLGEDDSWRAARLFPIVGIGGADEQERRATSALLAVLMGVKEFGRAITGRLGAPAGLVETYLEVPFSRDEAIVIPDGVLRVARAGKVWTALVEVKTSNTLLSKPQVESYIEVARERGYDAVVTISNELPAAPGEHPVGVDRRRLRKVALHHLAWAEIVHEGTMQLAHRGVADPTQAWVLSELLRYLQHPRSGASGFEDMGGAWVSVRESIVAGTLRPSDRKAPQVATSWDRLVRQVCLRKTGELGVDVTPIAIRRNAADPAARTATLVKQMVDQGVLTAGLRVPGAVSPLQLTAHVRTGLVEVSAEVSAPVEGRPLTRINWLLRQLAEAPEGLRIDVIGMVSSDGRSELLKAARADPKLLVPVKGEPKGFRLSLVHPLGSKRGIGRGGFITSVHEAIDVFYRDVVQDLRPWSPPPPKLPAHDSAAGEDQPEATDAADALAE